MRSSRVVAAVALAVLVGSTVLAAPASAQAAPDPSWPMPAGADSSFPAAFTTSMLEPAKDPAGANDWTCQPTAAHPYPVVLVHGTWEDAYSNWNGLSRIIKNQGYCVYAVNYGNSTGVRSLNGTGDMVESNSEVAAFVDEVLAATGAQKVDLVGHSQGGAQVRYYANLVGGTAKVNQVIALAPSNHPTTMSGITTLGKSLNLFGAAMNLLDAVQMPAAAQQADQSPGAPAPFYQQLNGNGETIPGMTYTNILTKYDEVVTPYTMAAITAGPGASVDNITIQDVCPQDSSEHLSISYSKNVAQIVLNKLDLDDQRQIRCYVQAPLTGHTLPLG